MKKLILLMLVAIAALAITTTAMADYDPKVDYLNVMINAASKGDTVTGTKASASRAEKIEALDLEVTSINFNDLYLLAKIMYAEAGSEWLSDDWKMCVGEVVLNRVASSEFPNTVSGVIYQKGQYYGSGSTYFANLKPSERCVRLALRLLSGERVMNDPSVVFQANFSQGGGVCRKFYDKYLGSTYFCYSTKSWLYNKVSVLEDEVTELSDEIAVLSEEVEEEEQVLTAIESEELVA
jgi:hypothetical protein